MHAGFQQIKCDRYPDGCQVDVRLHGSLFELQRRGTLRDWGMASHVPTLCSNVGYFPCENDPRCLNSENLECVQGGHHGFPGRICEQGRMREALEHLDGRGGVREIEFTRLHQSSDGGERFINNAEIDGQMCC